VGRRREAEDVRVQELLATHTTDETELGITQTQERPPPRPRATKLERGDALGRYVVLGTLGAGGMGVVHAAYDPELDRKLAIKLLLATDHGDQTEVRARLLREAQAIAKLSHPNVVAVHDVGLHDGQVFVAMEFVDGGTLGEWMKQTGSPRPWPEVLARFLPAGRGLAAAHAAGLVHRDFKPANVLLGKDGRPRVADFGIARSVEGEDEERERVAVARVNESTGPSLNELLATSGTLTRTGVLIGTPAYMAPEQFRVARVDARADQFAFCVALYEALYGQRPFEADTLHVLVAQITEGRVREPPRGAGVPTWLRKILLRGLASEPEQRWPDMNALLQALEHRPRRFARVTSTVALGIAVLAGAAAIASRDHHAEPPVCAGVEATLADTWSPPAREALAASLAARSSPAAREATAHVLPRLDAWAEDWRAGWLDACEATHLRSEQSSELLDLRMACLQRQRRRMDAYLDLLRGVDEAGIQAALDGLDALIEDLGDPARCADTEALMSGVSAPEDPDARARVEALAGELDPVYAALAAGEWTRAEAALEPLALEIQAEGWLPLSAELAYLQAQLHDGTRRLEPGEAAYRHAFVDALRVGDERLATKASRDLALLIAEWDSRHDEALEQLRVAEALAEHQGDADLRGSVALAQAITFELRGDFEDALAAAQRSAAAQAEAHGPSSVKVAEARYRESMILYRLNRIDEAREALEQARAGFGEDYGPHHPVASKMLNGAGVLALGASDWAAAEAAFAELLARKQKIFGPDHLDVSDALANLGAAQYNAGKFEAARESQERALAIREREMGADNLWVGHSLANLAVVYARLEDHELAEKSARRAFEIIAGVRGARHHDTMIAHSLVAEVLQLAGNDRAALIEFRAAAELAAELGSPMQQLEFTVQVATTEVHLGRLDAATRELDGVQALLDGETIVASQVLLYEYLRARIAHERGDEAGAREHTERARALLEEARSGGVGAIQEAETWLAEQG
jgi:tRNA A-37 threonylcarbamoyl transferase component Bud32